MALEFFEWAKKCKENGGCNNCDKEILGFKLTALTTKYIHVGCHKIIFKEMEDSYKKYTQWKAKSEL